MLRSSQFFCTSGHISSRFLPVVSILKNQVMTAPKREDAISPYKMISEPKSASMIGKRKAVDTAPILATEAANPAPLPRMAVGKTSPDNKYV